MTTPMLAILAERLVQPVDDSDRKLARVHLLDWLSCVAGGRDSEAAAMGGAISIRGWERATYGGAHIAMEPAHRTKDVSPGPAVMPAAFSMPSATMEQRLDAVVRGYEAALSIGASLDSHHFNHWHGTAFCGTFGACAAFGSVIGFAAIEYANALGNAGSVAGGLLHFQHEPGLLTGPWHIYHAVRTGRDAALHVHYGATGPQAVLEGAQGVFSAMTREAGPLGSDNGGWLIGTLGGLAETEVESVKAKVRERAIAGGLTGQQADRAIELALESDDVDAFDTVLEEWTQ
jgi:2-methylcitrate dehydratase PrpD